MFNIFFSVDEGMVIQYIKTFLMWAIQWVSQKALHVFAYELRKEYVYQRQGEPAVMLSQWPRGGLDELVVQRQNLLLCWWCPPSSLLLPEACPGLGTVPYARRQECWVLQKVSLLDIHLHLKGEEPWFLLTATCQAALWTCVRFISLI